MHSHHKAHNKARRITAKPSNFLPVPGVGSINVTSFLGIEIHTFLMACHLLTIYPPATQDGAATASLTRPGCEDAAVARQVNEINRRVLGPFGSAGALLAISTAVVSRSLGIFGLVLGLQKCCT